VGEAQLVIVAAFKIIDWTIHNRLSLPAKDRVGWPA
jgi:hypothetical protein